MKKPIRPTKPAVKPKRKYVSKIRVKQVTTKPGELIHYVPPWDARRVAHESTDDAWQPYQFEKLSASTKAIRRIFVSEYVKDFTGENAVLRMGYPCNFPRDQSYNWLRESYTQYLLNEYIDKTEEDGLINRNRIVAGLVREANYFGVDATSASRVAALLGLSKIMGMLVKKVEVSTLVTSGVMLVPMGGTPEEWEKNTFDAQTQLVANARTVKSA